MGAVYMTSAYGAGQDPWLYGCFIAFFLYFVGLWKFEKGKGCDRNSIGFAIYDEPIWGKGCIGGGLSVMFLIYFGMRFVFAFASFERSRNANVATYGFFQLAQSMVTWGLTNCWFKTQFARQQIEHGEDSIEYREPFMYRKTAILLGASFDYKSISTKFLLGVEILSLAVASCYAMISMLLGVQSSRQADDTTSHAIYFYSGLTYQCVIFAFLTDSLIATMIHRSRGLKNCVKSGFSTTRGRDQPYVQEKEVRPITISQTTLLLQAIYFIFIFEGYCPYVEYEKDLYHGGDPSEQIGPDLVHLLYFLLISKFLTTVVFRETLVYWKEPFYEDPNKVGRGGSSLQTQESNPQANHHQIYASVLTSVSCLVISVSIIIMDSQYKLDASMVGRIMYLVGYFYALEAVTSPDLWMIILDGRFKQVIVERLVCVVIVLAIYIIYILSMAYWLARPNDLKNNAADVPPFDVLILVTSIALALLKRLVIRIYKKHTATFVGGGAEDNQEQDSEGVITSSKGDNSEEKESEKEDDGENSEEKEEHENENSEDTENQEPEDTEKQEQVVDNDTDPENPERKSALTENQEPENTEKQEQVVDNDTDPENPERKSGLTVAAKMEKAAATAGPWLKLCDDLANITKYFFLIWVLYAIIWNGLGILLVLGFLVENVRLAILQSFMNKDKKIAEASGEEQKEDTKPVLSTGRAIFIVVMRFIAGFGLWFILTQLFYLASSPLPYYAKQVMIGGHRGTWTRGYAENAYESFDYAHEAGYHFVEIDYRMTSDEQLVVMHDLTLDRTTNGTGYVYDYTLDYLQNNLVLKKAFSKDELVENEYPYTLDEIMEYCKGLGIGMNHEIKQDTNLSAIPLTLNAICRNNVTETSFISTGSTKFQHLLYHMEPDISLEKDFLFHSTSMGMTVPRNVNFYAISAELLLFNTWLIPNQHAAGNAIICYFLAIETPAFINWFVNLGIDIYMLNNPGNCLESGKCKPEPLPLERVIKREG